MSPLYILLSSFISNSFIMAITQEVLDAAMQNAWELGFRTSESGEGTGICPGDLSECLKSKDVVPKKVVFKDPVVNSPDPIPKDDHVIPSEYDPALCDARVWAGGDGAQCSRARMDGENLCKGCFNRFSKLGDGFQLQFGLITDERPTHQMHVEDGKTHKWNDLKKEKKVKKVKKEKVKKEKALGVAELKSALTDGGVDFPNKVKKAELVEMHKQMLEGKIVVKEVKEEVKKEKKEKALSVAELKSALTDGGVDFPKKVKKAELVTLHKQMLEGKIEVDGSPQPVLELKDEELVEDTSEDIPEEEVAAPKEKYEILEYEGVTYQVNPRNHDVYDMSGDEVGTYEDKVIRWATTEMEEKHNAYSDKQDEGENSNSDSSEEDE